MQKQKVYWICDRCFKEIEKPIIEYDYQYMYELCEECDKEFHQYKNERKELESKVEIKGYQKDIKALQQENERLKHQLKVQEDLTVKNRMRKHIYKSRCEKTVEYFKYQLENLDFYEDTKARMLCAMGITLLQNGSDNE